MRLFHPSLLVAGASLCIGWFAGGAAWPLKTSLDSTVSPARTATAPGARWAIERCQENVTMVHDVAWAAACKSVADESEARRAACLRSQPGAVQPAACLADTDPDPDDSPECTLPEGRARMLNAARAIADAQCVAETTAGRASQ